METANLSNKILLAMLIVPTWGRLDRVVGCLRARWFLSVCHIITFFLYFNGLVFDQDLEDVARLPRMYPIHSWVEDTRVVGFGNTGSRRVPLFCSTHGKDRLETLVRWYIIKKSQTDLLTDHRIDVYLKQRISVKHTIYARTTI